MREARPPAKRRGGGGVEVRNNGFRSEERDPDCEGGGSRGGRHRRAEEGGIEELRDRSVWRRYGGSVGSMGGDGGDQAPEGGRGRRLPDMEKAAPANGSVGSKSGEGDGE